MLPRSYYRNARRAPRLRHLGSLVRALGKPAGAALCEQAARTFSSNGSPEETATTVSPTMSLDVGSGAGGAAWARAMTAWAVWPLYVSVILLAIGIAARALCA